MYVSPSGSVVYSTWHMFGSFVLLRALDAVVATAAADESDEALTVPFEAVVALEVVPTAAVGAAAIAAVPVARPESSDSSGFSAEKSSARRPVSIKHVVEAATARSMGTHQPAAERAKLQTKILPTTSTGIHGKALRPSCPSQHNSCLA